MVERKPLINFGGSHYEKQFCEIIWFWTSGSGDFVEGIFYLRLWQLFFWGSKTIYAILVEGIMRNFSVIFF